VPLPIALLAVGWVARRRLALVPREQAPWRRATLTVFVATALAWAGTWALARVLAWAGLPPREQPLVEALLRSTGDERAVFLVSVVLLAPLGEELFFRAFAFESLRRALGTAAGHAITALAFAAVHANPSGLPLYALLSLVLGESWRRTGRLAVPVAAHASFNAGVLASQGAWS
jgi:hypothetical protein